MMDDRLDRDEVSLIRVVNSRVRVLVETLASEFHMGQQADQWSSPLNLRTQSPTYNSG